MRGENSRLNRDEKLRERREVGWREYRSQNPEFRRQRKRVGDNGEIIGAGVAGFL
jgi:hypothetical protein